MLWNTMDDRSATLDDTDLHETNSWRLPDCDSFGLPILGRLLGYWAIDSSDWEMPRSASPADEP